MSWAALDDRLHADPRRYVAGLEAMGLWAVARSWIASQLTDGHIPEEAALSLAAGRQEAIERLLAAELWERVEGGYTDVDYLTQNLPRAEVLARKAARAASGAKGGAVSVDVRRQQHGTAQPPKRPPKQPPKQTLRATEANPEAATEPPYPVPRTPGPRSSVPLKQATLAPSATGADGLEPEDEVSASVARWLDERGLLDDPARRELADVLAEFDVYDPRPVVAVLTTAHNRGKATGYSGAQLVRYIASSDGNGQMGSLLGRELDNETWQEVLDGAEPADMPA